MSFKKWLKQILYKRDFKIKKMNFYIKLFYKLSNLAPGEMIEKEKVSSLGFMLSDLDRLHKEGYIFLDIIHEPLKGNNGSIVRHYIKLAPKGFSSLESHFERKDKAEKDVLLLDSTIVLMQIAVIGVVFMIYDKFDLNFSNPSFEVSFLLSVIFLIVFLAFSILLLMKVLRVIFSKKVWKGILFPE